VAEETPAREVGEAAAWVEREEAGSRLGRAAAET
jgi:hypothetical protein